MVDYFPLLKNIPCEYYLELFSLQRSKISMHNAAWFPGAIFKQKAEVWAKDVSDLNELPWKDVKSSVVSAWMSLLSSCHMYLFTDQRDCNPMYCYRWPREIQLTN